MLALRGIVRGNTVLLEEPGLEKYDGLEAIVTILSAPSGKSESGSSGVRAPGVAEGKFVCPDSIDEDNDLIAKWFGESV